MFIFFKPNKTLSSILLFSAIFGFLEFIRGSILSGFPWNLFVYSWSWSTEIIQCIKIFGLWFLYSFKTFSKTKGQIFFPNRQQNLKAFYNDTLGVGKAQIKREFFSVGKKEEDKASSEKK